jgi:hypothetical protein
VSTRPLPAFSVVADSSAKGTIMRPLLAAPLLGLLLMAGCAPQYLLSEGTNPSATSSNGVSQPLALHVSAGFTADERARIAAAVGAWNQGPHSGPNMVLAPGTYGTAQPGTWTIVKPNPAQLAQTDEWQVRPIAVTQRSPSGGGLIIVDVNRLGDRDLRDVVVQQIQTAAAQ